MKTAVVFFTRDGSTRVAAQVLAEKLSADIFELEEVKKRGGSPFSFMAAGFGAFTGARSRLKNDFAAQMGAYERICIGTPIWAGQAVPAVNTFVHRLGAKDKKVIVFAVQGDPDTNKNSAQKLFAALEKKGALVETMLCLYGADVGKTAQKEDIEKQISSSFAAK